MTNLRRLDGELPTHLRNQHASRDAPSQGDAARIATMRQGERH
jgi:hypothetical protein